ncbi:hypothetical protein EII29_09890 [Leptotrichia sp. OH3620_COT-345]|uniref:hypothetical protein n=1 Tax=Leptotrichia sp. OH3620_COT-345 TaxID=2491048 RepID=UPI000F64FD9A|nr:hypothetical protein [Leptotrichia sp. OH3620_COT-345]RRD38827.1 hypothetical protein EII29_09890 [Leptotrichia sp. OH3620_COT-345]
MKKQTLDLIKNINETTYIPTNTENNVFELFQLDTIADLRKVSRNFMKLYVLLNNLDNMTGLATNENPGIVKFGLENGNAVDVKDWLKGIGGILGGYVSKVSNKEAGKWYINDLTDGKIYKCIETHVSTSFDLTKYKDISNYGISDRLENLSNFRQEEVRLNSANGLNQQIFNLIAVGSLRIISFSNLGVKNEYETKFVNIPDWFCKNAVTLNFSAANGTGGAGGEVAECYFNATERSLSIFPSIRNGHIGNLQMTGQGITVARI